MPNRRHENRDMDGALYVTKISLSENGELSSPLYRSSPSDHGDSGFYNEVPVEVYTKPVSSNKNFYDDIPVEVYTKSISSNRNFSNDIPVEVHTKPVSSNRNFCKKESIPQDKEPSPGPKVYVYVPEGVSLDEALATVDVVHQVKSGYRQMGNPCLQEIKHVRMQKQENGPKSKALPVPVIYSESRPTKTKRQDVTDRESPFYAFSKVSHQPLRWSSPVHFKHSRYSPQTNVILQKPKPIRPVQKILHSPDHRSSAFRQIKHSPDGRSAQKSQSRVAPTEPKRHIRKPKPIEKIRQNAARQLTITNGRTKQHLDMCPTSKYLDQDYDRIVQICQNKGRLFMDQEFPANDECLGYAIASFKRILWKRPFVS